MINFLLPQELARKWQTKPKVYYGPSGWTVSVKTVMHGSKYWIGDMDAPLTWREAVNWALWEPTRAIQ